jgi:hypothetical protein
MARTKLNQRPAKRVEVPMGATGGRTPPSKITIAVLGVSIIAAIWAVAMLTKAGKYGYVYFYAYSEYYMGVITLVSLSITIMVGLVATDRLVLSIRQRVLLQSTHRTTGVIAVASLGLHLWTKLAEHHIRVIDMFIPFLAPTNTLYVGMGTLSGGIMVLVMWTGIARAKFIGRGKPWMWRSLHAVSYLIWPIALMHGLSAGRPAKSWVVVSYVICVLLVLVGLAVRLSVSLNRKKDFSSTSTGSMKPVGKLVPTSAPSPKKRSRREEPMSARVVADRDNAPAAVLETWVPAAGPMVSPVSALPAQVSGPPLSARPMSAQPMSAQPMSAQPMSAPPYEDEVYRPGGGSRSRRYAEEQEVSPRSARRYADIDPPRSRRAAEPVRGYDEMTQQISKRAIEDERYRYDEAEPPMPRSRRRAEEEPPYVEEPRPRSRRYAEEDEVVPPTRRAIEAAPAPRSRRAYVEDDEPVARPRRYDDVEPAPRSRRRAVEEEPGYDDVVPVPRPPRGPRYDTGGYEEVPRGRGARSRGYDEDPPAPPRPTRSSRYVDDEGTGAVPRSRGDRSGNVDRADSGRHSRSEFVDLAAPADPWRGGDQEYPPGDETPTLVDMASRRARRATQQEPARGASRGARRSKGRGDDDVADEGYLRQLRGEAQ